jgi:hypothetical protein
LSSINSIDLTTFIAKLNTEHVSAKWLRLNSQDNENTGENLTSERQTLDSTTNVTGMSWPVPAHSISGLY